MNMGLTAAGVDTTICTPHSTRTTSSSAAAYRAAALDIMLQTAWWSKKSTFATYYDKLINRKAEFCASMFTYA